MVVEWLVALIIAIAPHWGPSDCVEDDAVCTAKNEAKATELQAIAQAILDGSTREEINDPIVVTSVIAQESSFLIEPCERLVALEKIVSRTPDPEHEGRERIDWTCGERTCSRDAINISTVGDKLNFWVCSAGEYGMMQLNPRDQWVRSGTQIPGTDVVLPRSPSQRYVLVMEPVNNIALGCREMRAHREAYGTAHPNDDEVLWTDWIGRYNSGQDGNERYARRIAGWYKKLCDTVVKTETTEGGESTSVLLRDVWEGCTAVDEYLEE
jgi:hypothetical protein